MKIIKISHRRAKTLQMLPLIGLTLLTGELRAVSPQPADIEISSTWDSHTYVAFDTETTGLSPRKSRIVEIGAVKFSGGKIIEKKNWLINPGMPIPARSTEVHHITDEMVKDKPDFATIYPEFKAFIKGSTLLAHNAPFDARFISAEVTRCKKEQPPNLILDSLRLFRKWYPELKSHKLALVAEHLEITGGNFHRAMDDSIYLIEMFSKSINQIDPKMSFEKLLDDANGGLKFKPYEL